jgi:(2Fe-2S) ferredoxin
VSLKTGIAETATLGCMRHRRHLFVCVQHRDGGGKPACGDRGGSEILARIEELLIPEAGARLGATGTACLGPCFDGPNAVVYPDGEPAVPDAVDDAPALVRHLAAGTVHVAKRLDDDADE